MSLSIVIPVYNSEETIGTVVERLFELYGAEDLEVILVDDASRDRTAEVSAELAARFHPRVVLVALARNFGEHNAVMAGLGFSHGDWVAVMDDDFQNPPETVAELLRVARQGPYDVVYSRYVRQMHAGWRRVGSWINNLFATLLLSKPYDLYLSSFKVMSRAAVEQIVRYSGPYPYIDGLLLQSFGRIGVVTVPHSARTAGKSSYSVRKLIRLWLNTFTNFSVLPLRVAFLLGLLACALGMLLMLVLFYEALTGPAIPQGYLSLMTVLLVFSGLILIVCGLIGEYVGRILLNINGKPQFVIRRVETGRENPGGPRAPEGDLEPQRSTR